MLRSRHLAAALAFTLALACASAEKAGDKAAATGDWKAAEAQYAAALQKDPGKKDLQAKYAQAKAAALDQARRHANACWGARDVECAFAESDYVVNLDPGDAAMTAMRAAASREAALLRIQNAGRASAAGDHRGALNLLVSARQASQDPAVTGALSAASPGVVAGATGEANRLRGLAQYPAAIELLNLASQVDPSVRGQLQAVQVEYERWKDAEAERLAVAGDQALSQGRYADAETIYKQAVALRPQSRAAPLSRYSGAMARGLAAAQRRDFVQAERGFAEAAQMNLDRGEAAAQLERVKLRPYAIVLRSVLVKPVRPDGWPWAGARGDVDRLIAIVAGRNGINANLALEIARRLPAQNQPNLAVTISLPDGRAVQAGPRRGAYQLLDGSFTVLSNGFDDRVVTLRVSHDDGVGPPVEAGTVNVRIADLVSNREARLTTNALLELRVEAVPSDQPEGAVDRLQVIADRDNLSRDWSQPEQGSRALQVASAELQAPPGMPGALFLEVEQRGRVVWRSSPVPGPSARLTPRAVYLFVRPDEQVLVKVWAGEGPAARMVMSGPVTGRQLESGTARVNGIAGGGATLHLNPRRSGPGV